MSPEQAKATLVAFGIDPGRIQETKSSYRYTDGVEAHSTAEFLDKIIADEIELRDGYHAKKVREPSQCARMLQYRMVSAPQQLEKRVTAVLVDVPGWGTSHLATLEWIEAQRQAAVKEREGKASKPRL